MHQTKKLSPLVTSSIVLLSLLLIATSLYRSAVNKKQAVFEKPQTNPALDYQTQFEQILKQKEALVARSPNSPEQVGSQHFYAKIKQTFTMEQSEAIKLQLALEGHPTVVIDEGGDTVSIVVGPFSSVSGRNNARQDLLKLGMESTNLLETNLQ